MSPFEIDGFRDLLLRYAHLSPDNVHVAVGILDKLEQENLEPTVIRSH